MLRIQAIFTFDDCSYIAGLLLRGSNEKKQVGRGKSLVLLLGRLLMASLFIFVGVTQIERVIARDWVLHVQVLLENIYQKTSGHGVALHLCRRHPDRARHRARLDAACTGAALMNTFL